MHQFPLLRECRSSSLSKAGLEGLYLLSIDFNGLSTRLLSSTHFMGGSNAQLCAAALVGSTKMKV